MKFLHHDSLFSYVVSRLRKCAPSPSNHRSLSCRPSFMTIGSTSVTCFPPPKTSFLDEALAGFFPGYCSFLEVTPTPSPTTLVLPWVVFPFPSKTLAVLTTLSFPSCRLCFVAPSMTEQDPIFNLMFLFFPAGTLILPKVIREGDLFLQLRPPGPLRSFTIFSPRFTNGRFYGRRFSLPIGIPLFRGSNRPPASLAPVQDRWRFLLFANERNRHFCPPFSYLSFFLHDVSGPPPPHHLPILPYL